MDKSLFKGHTSLAEMVSTHIENWRLALTALKGCQVSSGDCAYLEHELKALREIEAAVNAIKNAPKELTTSDKLRDLMGYVENGTSISINMTQDDATNTFSVTGIDCGDVLWKEYGNSLEEVVAIAYELHAEK